MKNKGFTLTELLAVIAIIAILSVAAISGYSVMTNNSKEKSLKTKIDMIENAAYKYAKENSIDKKTTISVNKLVALGYLQPDEASDEGLSVLKNPVSGENMICNTIELTIVNNDVVVKYNKTKKNCSLSNEEQDETKINVVGYCSSTKVLTLTGDAFSWTNCDKVYLRTNPNEIDENKIESISFDYDGNSIVKKTGIMAANNVESTENNKNVVAVEGVADQVTKTDVGITYTMNDGKVYFRHVIVRIDKQKPTLTSVLKNNTKIGEDRVLQRSIQVYVDDASGSGANGFYISQSDASAGAEYEITDYKKTIDVEFGVWYLIPKDNVGNEGVPKKINVDNIPGELSCEIHLFKSDKVTEVIRNNNWYNYDIAVQEHAKKYNQGINYGVLKDTLIKNRSQLSHYIAANSELNYFYDPIQTADMEITPFYGGLWNVQHNGIVVCRKEFGIDKKRPTISITPNENTTFKKSHEVEVTITDPGTVISGFYLDGKDHMQLNEPKYQLWYAWVSSDISDESSIPITKWRKANPTGVSDSKLPLNPETTSKLTYTISGETDDYNGDKMTGSYRLIIKSNTLQDLAGNYNEGLTSEIFKHDNTPPLCESSGGNPNWVNSRITLTGTCQDTKDTDDQSGCDGNVTKDYNNEIDSTVESPGTVKDIVGNMAVCPGNQHTHIDKTPPTCTLKLSGTSGTNNWYSSDVVVSFDSKSDNVGISSFDISTSSTPSYAGNLTRTQSNETDGTVYYGYVRDLAGNTGRCSITVKVDKTPPTCRLKLSGTSGTNSWYRSDVKVEFDSKSSDVTNYNITSSATPSYGGTSSANHSAETTGTTYYGYVKDRAYNTGSCSTTFKIDKTPPTASVKLYEKKSADDITTVAGTAGLSEYTSTHWENARVVGVGSGTDNYSTVSIYKTVTGASTNVTKAPGETRNINAEGKSYLTFTACDEAGNCTDTDEKLIKLDRTDPIYERVCYKEYKHRGEKHPWFSIKYKDDVSYVAFTILHVSDGGFNGDPKDKENMCSLHTTFYDRFKTSFDKWEPKCQANTNTDADPDKWLHKDNSHTTLYGELPGAGSDSFFFHHYMCDAAKNCVKTYWTQETNEINEGDCWVGTWNPKDED